MIMEPYENQLIGAFLFQLGRITPKDKTVAINLFQQTPLDRAFGDLVVGADRCLVLEFKRNAKQLASEREKWSKFGLKELTNRSVRRKQAARGHIAIYGRTADNTVDMRWCSYLDVIDQKSNPDKGSVDLLMRYLAVSPIRPPVESNTAPRKRPGLLPADMVSYLKWLQTAKRKEGQTESASGREAWLGVATSDKGVFYVVADSIERLLQTEQELECEIGSNSARHPTLPDIGREP